MPATTKYAAEGIVQSFPDVEHMESRHAKSVELPGTMKWPISEYKTHLICLGFINKPSRTYKYKSVISFIHILFLLQRMQA